MHYPSICYDIIANDATSSHVAIDYYYVMWQTINPDVLYSDNWGTDTLNLHLRPFNRAPPTGPWTSRMVQRSEDFFPTCVYTETVRIVAKS
jgi:hypothetical protein